MKKRMLRTRMEMKVKRKKRMKMQAYVMTMSDMLNDAEEDTKENDNEENALRKTDELVPVL